MEVYITEIRRVVNYSKSAQEDIMFDYTAELTGIGD